MNTPISKLAVAIMLAALAGPPAVHAADAALAGVAGNWQTEPDGGAVGIVQVSVDASGNLQGRIVGGNHPGLKDVMNPDPAARNLALRGQVILRDMKYDGGGRWSGGTIYRASNGKTYKCNVTLGADGRLNVRGYIGFALLGSTQQWVRYTGTSMDLPPAH
ncbi:MAG: DUF2147 domain-containing protein [Gammaproteobacteria bacterium]|nr:DUF2147 domain-containing protein [Gammaproteobacteria bacterium]